MQAFIPHPPHPQFNASVSGKMPRKSKVDLKHKEQVMLPAVKGRVGNVVAVWVVVVSGRGNYGYGLYFKLLIVRHV
jgi:hypothetical protein